MTKILITGKPAWFEKDSHGAISFYRILKPLAELERMTEGIEIFESAGGTWPDVVKADVVFCHTPTHKNAFDAIRNAKTSGRKIWLDFDDLIFTGHIPKGNLAWVYFESDETVKLMKACINLADAISVSTQTIKDKLMEMYDFPDEKIWVIHNALPDELWNARADMKRHNGMARIMWRGSVTHLGDLMLFRNGIKPHKGAGYLFLGVLPFPLHQDYGGHLKDFSYQRWVKPLNAYFQFLKDAKPDYTFVCLERCDFNRAKSNIAWLETTYAGGACIAQRDMPEFERVPALHYESPKGLDNILKRIAAGEDLKTQKYIESRAEIQSKYLLSHTNKKRLEIIEYLS